MSSKAELKFSDVSDQKGFFKKYSELEEKPDSIIRIADKVDYYTVLGDDALKVAEAVYKTRSVVKENYHVPYVTISSQVFANVVKTFVIDQGLKIELYDRQWNLQKVVSPGNLQDIEDLVSYGVEDLNSNQAIGAVKMAERSDGKYVGLSYADTSSKILGYAEFLDNDLFSNLESALIQLNIREVLLSGVTEERLEKDETFSKLVSMIHRCEVTITDVKSSQFSPADEDLNKVLTEESRLILSTPEAQAKTLALGCLGAVLRHLDLLSGPLHTFELREYVLGRYMKLDLSALKALNLFPSAKDQGTKNGSIFGILNQCKSAEGTRMLSLWIKQPLTDLQEITDRHLLVGLLMEDADTRSALRECLSHVPDIRRLTRKFAKGKANLEDVVRVYQLILKLPDLVEALETCLAGLADQELEFLQNNEERARLGKLLAENWIEPLKEQVGFLYKLQEMVETTVDLEALDHHEYVIKAEFNEDLMSLKERSEAVMDSIRQCHQDTADALNKDPEKKLKLENHHTHGWCMRLTRNDASVLRGASEYQELQTVKAGVFFTTDRLREVSEEYLSLQSEYNRTQSSLVREIIEIASTYCPLLDKLSSGLAEIDVITSFAHVSAFAPTSYVRPKVHAMDSEHGRTVVREARHPCLEMQDDVQFIANDIELIRDQQEFLLITGPNMGGKSTYIKSVGIMCLMTQIGCFLPASEAEVCIMDAILARVGAGDSQLKGISTFMAEMLEMLSILKAASRNSLIIIDELGRGTSTYDGFGLAYSISEHIARNLHSFTMFATHFHELTSLSEKIPTVKNLHVVAHVNKEANTTDVASNDITLLYKVEPGISDQSFGIHVAEVVQFPQKIISMSKRKASELEEIGGSKSEDPYVSDKRTKCNPEEVIRGSNLLKKVLKEWKDSVNVDQMSTEEVVKELKSLVESKYADEIKQDKFLQEVLSL